MVTTQYAMQSGGVGGGGAGGGMAGLILKFRAKWEWVVSNGTRRKLYPQERAPVPTVWALTPCRRVWRKHLLPSPGFQPAIVQLDHAIMACS